MMTDSPLPSPAAVADDPDRPGAVYGRSRFRVDEPLPGVLYIADLAAILHVSLQRAYQIEQKGDLRVFEMKPRVGNRARYSGRKMQQWLDGDGESSRYFGASRRRG
jgi:hypothetical protein